MFPAFAQIVPGSIDNSSSSSASLKQHSNRGPAVVSSDNSIERGGSPTSFDYFVNSFPRLLPRVSRSRATPRDSLNPQASAIDTASSCLREEHYSRQLASTVFPEQLSTSFLANMDAKEAPLLEPLEDLSSYLIFYLRNICWHLAGNGKIRPASGVRMLARAGNTEVGDLAASKNRYSVL